MDEFNSTKITKAPLRVNYELTVMHDQKDMYLLDPEDGVTLDRTINKPTYPLEIAVKRT